ncbi:MAG: tetratricopeptide repeat protein [Rhodobiaceae bacterium]|nr:tetratricopeptide repeat protein [Rhodobiaceae bacterium]MCC0056526.1 tetratricopeptide repeat protein [Rhodobiaceae bacterium]
MSDIFREVDEDIRRDQFEQLWKRYGGIVIALALVIVVGVGGYRAWNWYQARQASAEGEAFFAAVDLAEQGKKEEAAAAFNALASQGGAYSDLARLRSAATSAAGGDQAGALAAYRDIAADTGVDPLFREIATIRAAYLEAGTLSPDEMEGRVGAMLDPQNAFRHAARELMALSAYAAGDIEATAKWAEEATADGDLPPNLRQRLEVLLSVIASQRAAKETS